MFLENIILRLRLSFHKERGSYLYWYRLLGFFPHNLQLYKQALQHKSMHRYSRQGEELNNERLEFLGDAILQSIVTTFLFHRFGHRSEGFLSVARSQLVCRESLNRLALNLGLHTLLNRNAHVSINNTNLPGNAFEALVGAIYLDRGYRVCQQFIERVVLAGVDIDTLFKATNNYKSELIEWAQRYHVAFEFELIGEERDRHGRTQFVSRVYMNNIPCGEGEGYTKKESHQQASRIALEQVKSNEQLRRTIIADSQTPTS